MDSRIEHRKMYEDDGADWQITPLGMIYAPQDFLVGNRAFVKCEDTLMRLRPDECASVESFLKGLEKSYNVGALIDKIQGFSFVGEILPPSRTREGSIFSKAYALPENLIE